MRFILLSIFMTMFLYANVIIGNVEQLKGNVKVKNQGSIKKSRLRVGSEVKEGDLIVTSKNSSAVLKLLDGSVLALAESSSLHFNSKNSAEQNGGKIYYRITSRSVKNHLKIKTPFAIIGIKGTTFVVNATDKGSVTLKEGVIGVASIKEEFNLYRKAVEEAYNKYIDNQMAEYEKYINQQSKYKEPVKTKEFDLPAGNRISFDNSSVHEDGWSEDDDKEFAYFESLIGDKHIDKVRKIKKSNQKLSTKELFDDDWNEDDDKEFDELETESINAIKKNAK